MSDDLEIPQIEEGLAERHISVSRLLYRAEMAASTWYRIKGGQTQRMHGATSDRIRAAYQQLIKEHDARTAAQRSGDALATVKAKLANGRQALDGAAAKPPQVAAVERQIAELRRSLDAPALPPEAA